MVGEPQRCDLIHSNLDRSWLAIRDTIGLRKQPKLPQDIVPDIASCTAYPRDISLYF